MITIINKKVFVDGLETRDPMLIGLAVLDSIENISNKEKSEIINNYFRSRKLRKTYERKVLVSLFCSLECFNMEDFVTQANIHNISRATAYNFINILKEGNIIKEKTYLFN